MKEQEIRKIVQEEIKKSYTDSFRSWRVFDSVTDQFSPITGASKQIGFFGTVKVAQPAVGGSRGGNAAVQSVMTALSSLGLLIDNTTA